MLCLNATALNGFVHKCYKDSALISLPISLRNSLNIESRPKLNEPKKFLVLSSKMKQMLLTQEIPSH